MLIKSSIFEHVSTSEHQRWLRLCMIAIVICLLATCPYLHNHVRAHTKAPVPCWYSHKQPSLTNRLLLSSSVLRLKWMAAFEECATFTCFCESVYLQGPDSSVPSRKKSRHASLIIHRLSAPLPHSVLWVQCKGRNQLPWIQLPQWGDGVSWCGEVVLSETESHCWFPSALPQPRLTAVFKAPVLTTPANTQIYLYKLNTKLFGLYENNSWRTVLSCM